MWTLDHETYAVRTGVLGPVGGSRGDGQGNGDDGGGGDVDGDVNDVDDGGGDFDGVCGSDVRDVHVKPAASSLQLYCNDLGSYGQVQIQVCSLHDCPMFVVWLRRQT